jgi:hypothetical protein
MSSPEPPADHVQIRLLGLPVDEQRRAAEHFDEVLREFAILRAGDPTGRTLPSRLLALREEFSEQFAGFTMPADAEIDAAAARGDASIDLVLDIPAAVGPACEVANRMLDDVDEFCRAGEHLLTLAPPARSVGFRRWLLGEFVRQVQGEEPIPWSSYLDREGIDPEG